MTPRFPGFRDHDSKRKEKDPVHEGMMTRELLEYIVEKAEEELRMRRSEGASPAAAAGKDDPSPGRHPEPRTP